MSDPDVVPTWVPGISAARVAARRAREPIVLLHLAKTGGTTIMTALTINPDWETISFPHDSQVVGQLCYCNDPTCDDARDLFDAMRKTARGDLSSQRLLVTNSHSTFRQTLWLARSISSRGVTPPILACVRPARDRLISMFRDYWNSYFESAISPEELAALRGNDPSLSWRHHEVAKRRKLFIDSQRFLSSDGRIDGRVWFDSFNPGRGFPFWLTEIFDSPEHMSDALRSGILQFVPLTHLDGKIEELTNLPPVRFRVSKDRVPAVEAAIEDSLDIIDRLASQDEPFDAVLLELFGDSFIGAKPNAPR